MTSGRRKERETPPAEIGAMRVTAIDTRPVNRVGLAELHVRTSDGRTFIINRRGWILDANRRSVPHPLVDEVMEAIDRWDRGA